MKKYLIHERKAGAQTDKVLDRVPIYADDYAEASEKFTEWVLGWMGADNSESAIQETAELRDYVAASGNLDSYSFDGVRYWFQEEVREMKTYHIDTAAGTMKCGSDDVTEEFYGDTSPSDPENTPESCLDFWLDEGWIVPGDVVKWDCVQVYPAPDPLNSALERISQDENISQAFRDGLRGLSL